MLTKKELITLSLFCAVYISWGLTDSIQAPFYPKEAAAKGATPAEYGFVFGVIHLAIFIWYVIIHTGAKTHFLSRNSLDFDISKMRIL